MDMNENKRRRSMLLYILIAIVAYLAISQTLYPNLRATQIEQVTYSQFLEMVDNDQVEKVDLNTGDNTLQFTTGEGESEKHYETTMWPYDDTLIQRLEEHGADANATIPDTSGDLWLMLLVSYGLPILIFLGIGWWLNRRMKKAMGDDGPSMNFGGGFGGGGLGKSNAKEIKGEETGVTFKDVAGQDEAKESLQEIVGFLKNPDKYTEIGARCPRGALLVGPPGTGKTLLAKAVAGEAGVTFFQIAGSAFVEMFVGRGAAKVRDLFKQANEKAPCIIFIDEIDAVGKRRDTSLSSNDEREQTLNQLLSEMDGFDNHKGIVVLAATNRPETLDQALLRPGRFDRRIPVELPDLAGREAILKIHADDVKMESGIDLGVIARSTPGASGADLANIINEAALRAVRMGRRRVTQEDLLESVDVVIAGEKKKSTVLSPHEKEVVSYHETGHAIVAAMQKGSAPVSKITIVPRTSGALGFTMQVEEDEHFLTTRQEARCRGAHLRRDDHRRLQRHREGHAARARHGHAVRHVGQVRHGAARPAREPLPGRRAAAHLLRGHGPGDRRRGPGARRGGPPERPYHPAREPLQAARDRALPPEEGDHHRRGVHEHPHPRRRLRPQDADARGVASAAKGKARNLIAHCFAEVA